MSLSLPHAIAVWRRNATMYRRTWKSNLLPNFFEPVFYLTAIGVGVGAYISEKCAARNRPLVPRFGAPAAHC